MLSLVLIGIDEEAEFIFECGGLLVIVVAPVNFLALSN